MQFGYSAMPAYCRAAQEAGYDYVELPGKVVAAMSAKEFTTFAATLNIPAFGINAFCPAEVVLTGPKHDLAVVCDYTEKLSKRAANLGVKTVGIGSPMSRNLPKEFDRELAKTQLENSLIEIANILGKNDITACLEALAACYCNTVNTLEEAAEIVRRLQHPNLNIVLDFYNMEHMGEADVDLTGIPFIHAHISDDDGAPNLRSYLKPEKREIHQKRIGSLVKQGYGGGITLEVDVAFDPFRAKESLCIMQEACTYL